MSLNTPEHAYLCLKVVSKNALDIWTMYVFSEKFFILFLFSAAGFPSQTLWSCLLKSNPYFSQTKSYFMLLSLHNLSFHSAFSSLLHVTKWNWVSILRSLCSRVAQLQMNNVWDKFVPRSKTGIACTLPCKIFPTMKTTEDVLISSDLQEGARVLGALNKLGRLMQKKLFFACLTSRIAFISKGLCLSLLLAERSYLVQNC